MKYLSFLSLLTWTFFSFAQDKSSAIDPESIDPEMRLLSYQLPVKNIKVSAYNAAHPSHFEVKLCSNCNPITYKLSNKSLLEHTGVSFKVTELTRHFIEQDYNHIEIGVNRDTQEITRISLNPVNKEVPEEETEWEIVQ